MTERIIVDANGRKHITHEPAPTSREYERGFIDGMQEQMRRSVDKAVNAMTRKKWVSLTDEEQQAAYDAWQQKDDGWGSFYELIEAALKDKNA